jgi:hypothetical protein
LHVHQRKPREPRRTFSLLPRPGEQQAHIDARVSREIKASYRFVESVAAHGVGTRNKQEVFVQGIALATSEPELGKIFVPRDRMNDVLVIKGALREELVLDVAPGKPGPYELL